MRYVCNVLLIDRSAGDAITLRISMRSGNGYSREASNGTLSPSRISKQREESIMSESEEMRKGGQVPGAPLLQLLYSWKLVSIPLPVPRVCLLAIAPIDTTRLVSIVAEPRGAPSGASREGHPNNGFSVQFRGRSDDARETLPHATRVISAEIGILQSRSADPIPDLFTTAELSDVMRVAGSFWARSNDDESIGTGTN